MFVATDSTGYPFATHSGKPARNQYTRVKPCSRAVTHDLYAKVTGAPEAREIEVVALLGAHDLRAL